MAQSDAVLWATMVDVVLTWLQAADIAVACGAGQHPAGAGPRNQGKSAGGGGGHRVCGAAAAAGQDGAAAQR